MSATPVVHVSGGCTLLQVAAHLAPLSLQHSQYCRNKLCSTVLTHITSLSSESNCYLSESKFLKLSFCGLK